MTPPARAEPEGRQRFADVRVEPTQEVLESPFGSLFRGGPLWPDFARQVYARHCRGAVARPADRRPRHAGGEAKLLDHGVWCGPIVRPFGHMIADFGMRIATSAQFEPDAPLLFSVTPGRGGPPAFFHGLLEHWRIPKARVRLVRTPVRVRSLVVRPQAERLPDAGPSEAHLDLLDTLGGGFRPAREKDIEVLYVSRSGSVAGGIAGEAYLERALAQLDVGVFHPESVSLRDQLEIYSRARMLIFSEGSAVHALQLLGRLDAHVAVIVRRPGAALARASLLPRCRKVTYVEAVAGLIHGLRPSGWSQKSKGLAVLDEPRLLDQLGELGLPLGRFWSGLDYRRQRDCDLARWRAARARLARRHPVEPLLIAHLMWRVRNEGR